MAARKSRVYSQSRRNPSLGTAGPLRQAGQRLNPPGMRPGGFTTARYGTWMS